MDSGGATPHQAGSRVNDSGAAAPRSRRRWLVGISVIWLLGAALVYFLHVWLLDEITAQAERRGVSLRDCQLDLGLSSIGLTGCSFSTRPDGRVFGSALTNVALSGSIDRLELGLSGLTPASLKLRGARLVLGGAPRLNELLGSGSPAPNPDLPLEVEQSALSWQPDASTPAVLVLTEIAFSSASRRLTSRFEVVRRGHGQLAVGPEGIEVTLGDPARPEVRLIVRVLPKAERAEVSLDLRRVPLRTLEGPWLQLTDTLRPVELEGRIFASVPLGLSIEAPAGDVHLTLHGLQFPVPRELDGLIHRSPPKLSGKLALTRSFDRARVADLSLLTGELMMRGDAELEPKGQGLAVKARLAGPLACRAIAQSAATAHSDSLLASLAGRFARRVLTGSVEVVAVLDAQTSDLERAQVFTSIGIGCGLEPFPVDQRVPRALLERLSLDALSVLPRAEPSTRSPRGRNARPRLPGLPGLLDGVRAPPP
jgi:hypothetical protein